MPTAVPCYEHGTAVNNKRPPRAMSTPPPSGAFRDISQGRRRDRGMGQGGEKWEKRVAKGAPRALKQVFSLHKISVEKFGHFFMRILRKNPSEQAGGGAKLKSLSHRRGRRTFCYLWPFHALRPLRQKVPFPCTRIFSPISCHSRRN